MTISDTEFKRQLYTEYLGDCGVMLVDLLKDKSNDIYQWHETRELEEKIIAYADAIHIGGELAKQVTLEIIEFGDEEELLGALVCLTSFFYDQKLLDIVIEKFKVESDEDRLSIFVLALKFAANANLSEKLLPLTQHKNSFLRTATAEILGYRGDADPRRIWPLFHDDDDSVKIAAMVAVMRLGFKEAIPAMEQAVLLNKDTFNEHCILPLLMLGSKKALQFVQLAMRSPEFIKPQYPIYLAFAGNQQDYTLFTHALKFEGMLPPVVEALGIYGNVQAMEFLLKQLNTDDDELKLETAKSLNMISGANLKETAIIVEQEEPDLDVDDIIGQADANKDKEPGDSREVEVQRHCTDFQIWSNWWQNNKGRFDPNQRYRFGKPYTFFLVLEEIAKPDTAYADRQRAYYELVIRSGEYIAFEPDWFVDKQIEALKKWQNWWNQNKLGLNNPWLFDGV